jgi:hypothetical protein
MKQAEDPIEVLCVIALLEKEATLGSRSGTKRRHEALGQVEKASWFRNVSSAEKDDVASIALLQKLDWDNGTIRENTHTLSPEELHATFFDRDVLTTRRTPTPSLASMSINASVLNKSSRPRRRSLTRGCVTRSTFAASACLSLLDVIAF